MKQTKVLTDTVHVSQNLHLFHGYNLSILNFPFFTAHVSGVSDAQFGDSPAGTAVSYPPA